MSSEATGTNRFYSASGKYLSPLERKRLRAIENELPQAEQHKQAPNKRITRTRTPKRQASVKEAPKKRKRSVSTSSGFTNVRPKKQTGAPKTPASEKKSVVIPLSDKILDPPPSDESSISAPPAKKVRKFFSSGLRFPTDGSGTSAAATTVSWNKKFKLQFKPAVTSVKKSASTPAVSIKKEVLMTVPYRPLLKLGGVPQAGDERKKYAAAQPEKKQDENGNRSTTAASSCIGDVEAQQQGGLDRPQNDSASETSSCVQDKLAQVEIWLSKVDSTGVVVSNHPPKMSESLKENEPDLECDVTDASNGFDDQPVEGGQQSEKNSLKELFTSILEVRSKHNESDLATPDTVSLASSTDGDIAECSLAPPDDSCATSELHGAESSEAAERPSTPLSNKACNVHRKTLYPIFSTPSSTRERTVLHRIPTSPIGMPKKKFIAATSDPSQLIIDAGQKKFGHTTCPTCSMVYTVSDVDDERLHMKHHQSFLAVKFAGWKNQREVGLYPDGKVVMVSPNDPKVMLKKMEEIQQMVDRELGIVENASASRAPHMFFLFVSHTKKVLGFLAAREIKQGYRVIPDDTGKLTNCYCCECDPVPAVCGVSRIWTAPYYRRKKVASRLLDRLRMNFSFGCPIGLGQIAFSDPTLMGRELAASYTRNDRFLVFGP